MAESVRLELTEGFLLRGAGSGTGGGPRTSLGDSVGAAAGGGAGGGTGGTGAPPQPDDDAPAAADASLGAPACPMRGTSAGYGIEGGISTSSTSMGPDSWAPGSTSGVPPIRARRSSSSVGGSPRS